MWEEERDRRLVEECLQGSERAFEALVDSYQKVLFNVALRMVNDYEDARDIAQTTFIKAFQNLRAYDPRRKFFSWVYRITVNESLNLLDRRKPQAPIEADLVLTSDTPEERHNRSQVAARVQAAVMTLPVEYREIVVLRHFASLSYQEMSALLGISEKTVKSRLFTARQLLRSVLLGGIRTRHDRRQAP